MNKAYCYYYCYLSYIIIIKAFIKCKILSVETVLSTCMCTCARTRTHSHMHPHILTIENLFYTQLKWTTNTDLRQSKTAAWTKKTWQVCCVGKRDVLRLELKESREGICRRGRGRSFHVEGLSSCGTCICSITIKPPPLHTTPLPPSIHTHTPAPFQVVLQ